MIDSEPQPDGVQIGGERSSAFIYDEIKSRSSQRNQKASFDGRNIAPLPAVFDPERRQRCRQDFRLFCEEYFPDSFTMAWSEDHLRVIKKIETCVLKGGLFALAMPRGAGKTTLCTVAAIWSVVYGHRKFVMLIGASQDAARELLTVAKEELEFNEGISEDFPEVNYPIARLEGSFLRCQGQHIDGHRTRMKITADEMTLPDVEKSISAGATIRVAGLLGRVRGAKKRMPSGEQARPDLVILDDPQTDDSARSDEQNQKRLKVLRGAILGLAGPDKKIAGIMPCTVIENDDMADQILDRKKNPQWQGERCQMVYSFPDDEKLWDDYERLRVDSPEAATEFYIANRAAMDAGAVVGWKDRYNEDEESAIQHAMNLKIDRPVEFWAEFQNDPMAGAVDDDVCTSDEIRRKLNNFKRGQFPESCTHLTAFVDVQKKYLYYCVVAWESQFTGYVIDYGTFPDVRKHYFQLKQLQNGLARKFPGAGLDGSIYQGLQSLCGHLLERGWKTTEGTERKIDLLLVDANWGETTEVVYKYVAESGFDKRIYPSHGKGIRAGQEPFASYIRKPGDIIRLNCRIPLERKKRKVRHVLFDTNFWKSFVHSRFKTAVGDKGCLTVWGDNENQHQLFADHLTAESSEVTEGRGRVVREWALRPERPDNHWFDGIVGCAVAAEIAGVDSGTTRYQGRKVRTKKRMSLKEIQQQKGRQ